MDDTKSEAARLESLWASDFGDEYIERNRAVTEPRSAFWQDVLNRYPSRHILEVGCNIGLNIHWIRQNMLSQYIYGLDVNWKALGILRTEYPDISAVLGTARELPFPDSQFDMVFTAGVLIHQPDITLHRVMSEIVRCSRSYILCAEYYAPEPTEVPYRGQSGALIKRDFGTLYQNLFPSLILQEKIFLGRAEGWDDVTCWVFGKPHSESGAA